jgi:CheY-like chemotaxis protein
MLNGLFKSEKKSDVTRSAMVVGDDQEVLRFLSATLESENYTVVLAQNVETAIALLNDIEMPNVFIGDFRDPEIDGAELIRRLRLRYGKNTLSPIIFLIDSAEDETVARKMEVYDVLAKPLSAEGILRCLQTITT